MSMPLHLCNILQSRKTFLHKLFTFILTQILWCQADNILILQISKLKLRLIMCVVYTHPAKILHSVQESRKPDF